MLVVCGTDIIEIMNYVCIGLNLIYFCEYTLAGLYEKCLLKQNQIIFNGLNLFMMFSKCHHSKSSTMYKESWEKFMCALKCIKLNPMKFTYLNYISKLRARRVLLLYNVWS